MIYYHTVITQHNPIKIELNRSEMCIVTLSVLEKCQHELATIDYCPSAEPDEADGEENPEAGEASTTLEPCTDSLGWEIYKSLDV